MTLTKLREIAMAATQGQWVRESKRLRFCSDNVISDNQKNEPFVLASMNRNMDNWQGDLDHITTFDPAMVLKLLDCVEALEFYAAGHNPNEDYSKHRDGEVIPKMTKLKHTDSEGRDWIPLPVFCTHGLRMGHLARQALAALKETK